MSASMDPENTETTETTRAGSAITGTEKPVRSSNGNSPITGIIDEKQVIIDFGKYEGKSIQEIAELDPAFYTRLAGEKENGVFAIRRSRDKSFRLYINPLSGLDH